MTNFVTFIPSPPPIHKNKKYIYCLKTKESTNTWQISGPLPPQPTICLEDIDVSYFREKKNSY